MRGNLLSAKLAVIICVLVSFWTADVDAGWKDVVGKTLEAVNASAKNAQQQNAGQVSGGQGETSGSVDGASAATDNRILGFDVIGVKLGMTMAEVESSMKANHPEMALKKTMTPPRIPFEGKLELPYYEFRSPPVDMLVSATIDFRGRRSEQRQRASLNALTVTFAPESVGGGAVRIDRAKLYEWEQGPSFENLLSSIKKKYGDPEWSSEESYRQQNSKRRSGTKGGVISGSYGYNHEGKSVAEPTRDGLGVQCDQTHTFFGGLQKGHPYKCSQYGQFSISGGESEGVVISRSMRMLIVDWTPLREGYQLVANAQNAAFEEQQRKKQEQVDQVEVEL